MQDGLTNDIALQADPEWRTAADPFPNVDAISGAVLWEFGMTQMASYTVVFGISRGLFPLRISPPCQMPD